MAKTARQMRQLYALCATALVLGRADLDGADNAGFDIAMPIFTVGQVAEIANIHPQTLRQYDRVGLVVPQRAARGATAYATSTAWFRRKNSARMRASIFRASRASSNCRRKPGSCAVRSNACARKTTAAYSQPGATATSSKCNDPTVHAVGGATSTPQYVNCHPAQATTILMRAPIPSR